MTRVTKSARVTEIEALAVKLLAIYANDNGLKNDTFYVSQFEQLRTLWLELVDAIKRGKAQSDMEEKDTARDKAVCDFADMITGYMAFPIPEKREAAATLKAIFDKYGRSIINESYDNESGFIDSLLRDLNKQEIVDVIAKLDGMGTCVEKLSDAQQAFITANYEWAKAQQADAAATNATKAKHGVILVINERLVPYLSARSIEPAYKVVADLVEQEIAKTNAAVDSRSSKGEKA